MHHQDPLDTCDIKIFVPKLEIMNWNKVLESIKTNYTLYFNKKGSNTEEWLKFYVLKRNKLNPIFRITKKTITKIWYRIINLTWTHHGKWSIKGNINLEILSSSVMTQTLNMGKFFFQNTGTSLAKIFLPCQTKARQNIWSPTLKVAKAGCDDLKTLWRRI